MKLIVFSILIVFNFCSYAQPKKIDSLLAVLNNYPQNDSLKVVYLTNVFKEYKKVNNFAKLKEYSDLAIDIAKKLPQSKSLISVYFKLGICYHGCTKYIEAINAYNAGIAFALAKYDYQGLGNFYLNLSALYKDIPEYNKALIAADSAAHYYTKAGSIDNVSGCFMNISSIYTDLKNPVTALSYINKAMPIFLKENNGINYGVCEAFMGIADNYKIASNAELSQMGISPSQRHTECLKYLFKALDVALKVGEGANTLVPVLHNEIGKTYQVLGNNALALQYFKSAFVEYEKNSEDKTTLGDILYATGEYYFNSNNYDSCIFYLNKSLEVGKAFKLLAIQQQALLKLSSVYETKGDYKNAHLFFQQYIKVKDEIINEQKEKEITRKQLQIDFGVKEKEYKLTQQVNTEKLKQQQQQINFDKKLKLFFALALLLLAIIAVLIYRDRAKTKKLNAIIHQQKESLEQLGVVKDKIFSVVSHDMRAPVNALMSFINILENGNLPPEKLNLYAKDLKQNLSSTSSLMNNMLNWAASQMQGFKVHKEPVPINELVADIIKSLEHHWQSKNIQIQNEVAAVVLHTDVNMLAAIIRNLLSNAFKFSYPNGVVRVHTIIDNNICKILIADTGTGMLLEQIAAFNSTNQLQVESKRGTQNEKGTGLGLMLCKTFAHQLGGNITAQKNDAGTSFILELTIND